MELRKENNENYVQPSQSPEPEEPPKKKKRSMKMQTKETWAGYLFISPMVIGTTVLVIIPILMAIIVSFTDWVFIQGIGEMSFVGLDNYQRLLSDDIFLRSVRNNAWLIAAVPVTMFFSLILAIIINKHVYMKSFFKIVYFLPYISSIVAIAIVFQLLFHPSYGPINEVLMTIGIENPPRWLADSSWALVSVIIITIWTSIGFNLIIYLAALQNISLELYEAADMDGANIFKKFRHITVPLVSPTTFFLLITGIVYSFKSFELIVVLTSGGPGYSTSVIVYYLYEQAFEYLRSGYSSAISIVLLLMLFIITAIQWYGQKKWVNY
ncbi:carbohydrate ABC transporter permease [Alkalicoccus daliensis]|uniref:Multiple sugar transport system permease protein n=1 Tax=Alkalicoccus daliensis TaxID=745820 RepID=A0A1H0GAP2_9BACI|nr:sugar ABC transporter permease [Alkalicoccus daliensis]SDO03901.1 multiple sugar transport system permease protein [Alkalicoccus daliensis]